MSDATEPIPYGTEGRPASRLQTRLWFFTRLYPELPFFMVPILLRLHGNLDHDGVRAALRVLTDRHETLRTRLVPGEEGPVQVLDDAAPELAVTDLTGAADLEQAWSDLLTGEYARPLDVERGPLVRAHLARTGPAEHRLALFVHHISVDGTSLEVLLNEFAALYDAWASGRPLEHALGPVPESYDSFSRALDEELSGPEYEQSRAFWRAELGGQPEFDPPADRPRPSRRTFEVHDERTVIPAELAAAVREAARHRRSTPYVLLAGTLAVLLGRRNGPLRDVVIAAPWSLRGGPWLDGTVGFFINTVPMRVRMTPASSFTDVLAATRGAFLDAMDHGSLPFDEIVALVNPVRDARRLPITSVSFQVLPSAEPEFALGPVRAVRQADIDGASEFDLVWDVIDPGDGAMTLSAKYTADIYDRDTVRRMTEEYVRLLGAAVADPDRRVVELPLYGEAERARLRAPQGAVREIPGLEVDGCPVEGPFLLLDDVGRPVPVGALGAVYVPVPGPADPTGAHGDLLPGEPAGLPGGRLRPTGALARRRPDGTADLHAPARFPGTPGTTVAVLERHPSVRAAVLAPAPGAATGTPELIAYVATDDTGLTPAALREFLSDGVRPGDLPGWFVLLDELPVDDTGQPDLAELDGIACATGLGPPEGGDETGTELEETVRGVWQEHLGGRAPALDAAFFDVDGHSLIAVRIVARLQRLLGRPIPVRAVFDQPTVRSFAAWLVETGTDARAGEPTGAPSPRPAEHRPAAGTDRAPAPSAADLTADLLAASSEELAALRMLTACLEVPADHSQKERL